MDMSPKDVRMGMLDQANEDGHDAKVDVCVPLSTETSPQTISPGDIPGRFSNDRSSTGRS